MRLSNEPRRQKKLEDVGAPLRARNAILAGVSGFMSRGNALRERVPPQGPHPEPVMDWKREVDQWAEETRAYPLTHSRTLGLDPRRLETLLAGER